jgi:hypothetical protein
MVSADATDIEIAVTDTTTEANKELRKNLTPYPSIAAKAPTVRRTANRPNAYTATDQYPTAHRYHELSCGLFLRSIQN